MLLKECHIHFMNLTRLINVGVRRDARLISPDTHVIDMTGQNLVWCQPYTLIGTLEC